MSFEWATVLEKVEWYLKLAETRYEVSRKPETKREIEDLNEILYSVKRMAPEGLKTTEGYIKQLSNDVDEFNEQIDQLGEQYPELKDKQKHAS